MCILERIGVGVESNVLCLLLFKFVSFGDGKRNIESTIVLSLKTPKKLGGLSRLRNFGFDIEKNNLDNAGKERVKGIISL